jgi:hypothetical protein
MCRMDGLSGWTEPREDRVAREMEATSGQCKSLVPALFRATFYTEYACAVRHAKDTQNAAHGPKLYPCARLTMGVAQLTRHRGLNV